MKRLYSLFVILFALTFTSFAQKTEFWRGELNSGIIKLPITLELKIDKDTTAFMGSPSQSKQTFKAKKVVIRNDSLMWRVNLGLSKVVFKGAYLTPDSVCGTFSQSGQNMPLCLTKTNKEVTVNRPQTPKNIDYICEEVKFNVEGVNYDFHGTLTYPKKGENFPAIILLSGSGLQDRNEEILRHKPFEVIADYMARNGIAVLRFDDRGWGTKDMELLNATTLDYANDAEAAFKLLASHPKINHKRIGFAGHSEGGLIAPIAASRNKDVAFIIMLAGPGVNGMEVLIEQNKVILSKMGYSQKDIDTQIEMLKKRDPSSDLGKPWFKCFLDLEPKDYLGKLKIPVLALNGENDTQVIASQNLSAIEQILKSAGNTNYKIVFLPSLNHLFQECKTGLPNEYYSIEQTIAPNVLEIMKDFVEKYVP